MNRTAIFAVVVGAAATVAFPTASLAQMTLKGPDSGWYIGGNLGMADFDEFGDDDTSFKILGGYQINRNFGVEVGYIDFGKVDITGGSVKASAFELVGVGTLPINDKFSVIGKLGFARGEGEANTVVGTFSDDSVEVTYGVGVKYNFTPVLGVTAEYQAYPDVGNGGSDINVFSVGVVYRFR